MALLLSSTSYPLLNKYRSKINSSGKISTNNKTKLEWLPNFITLVGQKLDSYLIDEFTSSPLQEVETFSFSSKLEKNLIMKFLNFRMQ